MARSSVSLISGTTKPYWLRELAAHLGDALRQLAVRLEQGRRDLLAEAELDLRRSCSDSLTEWRASSSAARGGFLDLGLLRRTHLRPALRDGVGDEAQAPSQNSAKGRNGRPGASARTNIGNAGKQQGAGIVAELAEDGLLGRAARAALRNQQAGGERDDQRRDLRDEAVADGQLGEDVGGGRGRHVVARHADDDAAEDVDGGDDEAGDGVAAHELRGAVHRAEEGALLLQLAAAARSPPCRRSGRR